MFLTDEIRDARELHTAARDLVGRLQPGDIPRREARMLFDELVSLNKIITAGTTLLAGRVVESKDWEDDGAASAADWLAARCGTSADAQRRAVATAKRLAALPHTDAAFRRGDLSLDQAAAVADASSRNAAAESKLLDLAGRASLRELRDAALRAKATADPDPDKTQARIHKERRLRTYTDAEGAWNLSARGTADQGSQFAVTLNHLMDGRYAQARAEGRTEPREAHGFDALIDLATTAWHHLTGNPREDSADETEDSVTDDATSESTDPTTANESADNDTGFTGTTCLSARRTDPADSDHDTDPDHEVGNGTPEATESRSNAGRDPSAGKPDQPSDEHDHAGTPALFDHDSETGLNRAQRRQQARATKKQTRKNRSGPRPAPRNQALLRVDVSALWRGYVEGDELCELAGVGPIPVKQAIEMLTDSAVKLVITRGVDVVNVTSLGRKPTEALRAAILWREPQCSVEGCNRLRLEYDHRIPWAQTHHTRLDELDGLCAHHHRLKTHQNWALIHGTGKRPMVSPDDPRHPHNTRPAPTPAQGEGLTLADAAASPPQPFDPARSGSPLALDQANTARASTTAPAPASTPQRVAQHSPVFPIPASRPPQPAGADTPDLFDHPEPDDLDAALTSLLSPTGV